MINKISKSFLKIARQQLVCKPQNMFNIQNKKDDENEKQMNAAMPGILNQQNHIYEQIHQQNSITENFKIEEEEQSTQKQKPDQHPKVAHQKESMFGKIKHVLKHGIQQVIDGTKKTYHDYKFTKMLLKNKTIYTDNYDAYEMRRIQRIKKDFFKLIPFSVFIIIPALETLIPAYIMLFVNHNEYHVVLFQNLSYKLLSPNAFPTQYLPADAFEKKFLIYSKRQAKAHEVLIKMVVDELRRIGVPDDDLTDKESVRNHFMSNKKTIEDNLHFDKLDSDTLILIAQYMRMDYITGTHILNQIQKHTLNLPRYLLNLFYIITRQKTRAVWTHPIFNYEVKFNFFIFEKLKRQLLVRQIEKHIQQLKVEDHAIFKYGFVGNLNLLQFAIDRGITETDDQEIKEYFNEYWIPLTCNVEVSDTLYLQYTLLNHENNILAFETL